MFTSFSATWNPIFVNFFTNWREDTFVVLVANLMSKVSLEGISFYILSNLKGILFAFKRSIAWMAPGMTLESIWIVPLRSISKPLTAGMCTTTKKKEINLSPKQVSLRFTFRHSNLMYSYRKREESELWIKDVHDPFSLFERWGAMKQDNTLDQFLRILTN